MLFFIISLLIVQNKFIEITSELILNSPQYQTDCTDGLRSGIDVFNLTGSVGPDFNDLVNNAGWLPTIYGTIQSNSSGNFNNLCPISIGVNGSSCNPNSTRLCYCSNFDLKKQTAYLILNYTAQAIYSNATIRLEWQNPNKPFIYSDSQNISRIYDLPKLEFTIQSSTNKINRSQISEKEIIVVSHNDNVSLEFTCSETASPCYVNIFKNGNLYSGTQSVHVNFINNMTGSDLLNITAEYAICSNGQYKHFKTFFLQQDEDSTTVTSTISTTLANGSSTAVMPTSSPKTIIYEENQNHPHNNLGLKIGLPVGLGICAIGICAVCIICYKKKKMKAKCSMEQLNAQQNAADNSSNNDGKKTSSTEGKGNKMRTDENKSNRAETNKPDNKIKYTRDREQEGKEEINLNINVNGNINDKVPSRPLPPIKKSDPIRPASIEETHGNS